MVMRFCAYCGEEFSTKSSQRLFCGEQCYKYSKKKKSSCIICGTPFFVDVGNKKTCSAYCASENKKLLCREWRAVNPDSRRIHKRTYYEKNRVKILESARAYYKENRDEILDRMRDYRENNASKIKKYRDENPHVYVRSKIRSKLGIEPDGEILELATIRRKLFVAIKKAGE